MYVDNRFRVNTPANINFGRWVVPEGHDPANGALYGVGNQLGSACFVIPVADTFGKSTTELNDGLCEAWLTQQHVHKWGGGTGFAFSRIRPKGSLIGYNSYVDGMNCMDWSGGRGTSSGYESFLTNFFNASTEAVKQGNTRRGANMGIQRLDHMDFLDQLYAKHRGSKDDEFKVKNFNLSVAATDEVMQALSEGGYYTLYNPLRAKHRKVLEEKFGVENPELVRKQDLATRKQFEALQMKNKNSPFAQVPLPSLYLDEDGSNVVNAYDGKRIGIVMNDVVYIDGGRVRDIFSQENYTGGEPGIVFLDRMNEMNPLLLDGEIEAPNPCGEQPLPANGACDLGSINSGKFVRYGVYESREAASSDLEKKVMKCKFTKVEDRRDGKVGVMSYDWDAFDETVEDGVRFLDNVIDRSDFPSQKIDEQVRKTRNIGLGLMGVWDTMVLMKLQYGGDESVEFAGALAERLHDKAREASQKLAEERGVFPAWEDSFHNPDSELYKWFMSNPKTIVDMHRGERKLASPDVVNRERVMAYGREVRNAAMTTQAPTGTIRRTCGEKDLGLEVDNLYISSGIEAPHSVVDVSHILNTKLEGVSSAAVALFKREGIYSKELIDAIRKNEGGVFVYSNTPAESKPLLESIPDDVRDVLVTSAGGEGDIYEISPDQHATIAATFQERCDSAISKTVTLPSSAVPGDVWLATERMWRMGGKGITAYVDRSREYQIVNKTERGSEVKEEKKKIRRPLLQRSFTIELPFPRPEQKGRPMHEVTDVDFQPDRCFTTVAYNPVHDRVTGVFQNFPVADPNLISTAGHRNIALSRDLKGGKPLGEIIEEAEKMSSQGVLPGRITDVAVAPAGDNFLRHTVEASTLTNSLLKSLYVVRFLTGGGEHIDDDQIQERMDVYHSGELSLKTIIAAKGFLDVGDAMVDERPSIFGGRRAVKVISGSGIPEKLCPECI
ncbi:hypothetical protein CMI37_18520 [Candidatus Pacearchaeota archaeon]|nr:hypothetical protein [Candidatus Pacearchaeota archaeon]